MTNPTVFTHTLECGHEYLATRIIPVGSLYTCWTFCEEKRAVVTIELYEAPQGVGFLVASNLNDEDMLKAHRTVKIANERLASSQTVGFQD